MPSKPSLIAVLNDDSIDDFVLCSRLKGHEWLLPSAQLAQQHSKELTVFDDAVGSPHVRVTDLETQKWLDLLLDSNTEVDDVDRLITEFPDIYAQMVPIEGDEDNEEFYGMESLAHKIVDVLTETADPEEFIQDFSRDQERVSGRPLDPTPTGKDLLRAIQFETGHKLYVWRTTKQREHYGNGPASFYLGFRFVSPSGLIIREGEEFHPGGRYRGEADDNAILMLVQDLMAGTDDIPDENLETMTPEQRAWADDPARESINMDVAGHDGFENGYPAPWKDLPIKRRKRVVKAA